MLPWSFKIFTLGSRVDLCCLWEAQLKGRTEGKSNWKCHNAEIHLTIAKRNLSCVEWWWGVTLLITPTNAPVPWVSHISQFLLVGWVKESEGLCCSISSWISALWLRNLCTNAKYAFSFSPLKISIKYSLMHQLTPVWLSVTADIWCIFLTLAADLNLDMWASEQENLPGSHQTWIL